MDRRPKPNRITASDINDAWAAAHIVPAPKESRKYWAIKQQIAWEHRQKILAGHKRARAEGKRIGRPPVTTFGERIGRMRERGMTWWKIADFFKKPASTIYRHYDMYLREKGLPGASKQRVK